MRDVIERWAVIGAALLYFFARPSWESVAVLALLVGATALREWREHDAEDIRESLRTHETALAEVEKALRRHGEKLDGLQAAPKATRPPL